MAIETAPAPGRQSAREGTSIVRDIRNALSGNIRQYGMMIALLLLVAMFQILTDGLFLQPRNVTSLLVQNGYILILAIGMVMVIIAGHIDLSVGSVCAFVGATVALAMAKFDLPWPAAILLGLALGILVGIWQGFWVAYVGIPAFIVTLAGMLLFRGLDLIILNAESIPVPESFQKIANGYIPEMGPVTGYHNPTLVLTLLAVAVIVYLELRKRADLRRYGMDVPRMVLSVLKLVVICGLMLVFGLLLASYKGVPVVGLILGALVVLYTYITQRTVLGRHIYAVGGNSNAARLSGVDTRRVDLFAMVNMGFLAAIAGMVFTAYLNAANPKDGVGFELDAIAAVFVGGAAVAGGVGTVTGSMVGGLVMGVLNLGLANLSVDSNYVQIIKGLVLLGAVALDVLSKYQGRPSFIGMIINGITRGRGTPPGPASPTPVRADETVTPTGVVHVARTHRDDLPEGVQKLPPPDRAEDADAR
ncbi:multiple monosaccharide ABC transporter permease [Terrabacter sp. MAHUQ-38]|jgi:putative multiple sugar transport system permease protein|uniref:multiple monosaccharide ABC transporter permease n=1 Tax=unclassified Terrabacter TaxID=2630222 RepID=UPI00165D95EE|nr:multiple monosaccharide ABC transporter permease [Terrabacter sp. MAHUQ-38]MBC9823783.1 sugar ABC transporter permease [Terrabacter sp. MAHUQ-38]